VQGWSDPLAAVPTRRDATTRDGRWTAWTDNNKRAADDGAGPRQAPQGTDTTAMRRRALADGTIETYLLIDGGVTDGGGLRL
jgi:hypothetical protein